MTGGSLSTAQKQPSVFSASLNCAIDRFDHISVAAEIITLTEVRFFAGRSQHDDGQFRKTGIGPNLAQNFDAIELGNLDVEKNNDGRVAAPLGVGAAAEDIIERFGAVAHDIDLVGEVILGKGLERHLDVIFAVL